jgi:Mg-chelatase subunit ChlD
VNRSVIAVGLIAAAGLWVAVLAATSGGPAPIATTAPLPSGAKVDRAAIKFVDKANFTATDARGDQLGEITLRMDVLDAAGKPIADLRQEDVTVVEGDLQGRIKSFRGPASQAVNVILVMDVSGSMAQQGRIAGARRAAHAALDALKNDRDRIGLIAFDDHFDFRVPFGTLTADARNDCARQIDRLRPRSGTLIGPPIIGALRTFDDKKPDGLKLVLLMTDGDDNDRERFSRQREQIGDLSDKLGVQVHAISVGDEVSAGGQEDLSDLAAKGKGRYEHSPGPDKLAELFRSRIAETVNECTLVYDSPYPTADGFDRPVTVSIRTPAGPLTATASYKIGPLLSARSKPAAWALAPQTVGGAAPSTAPRAVDGLRGPLFAILLIGLLAALAIPSFRKKGHATEAPPVAPVPSGPQAIRPPPPPPRVGTTPDVPSATVTTPAPRFTPQQPAAVATPKPTAGSVLKPPPPPPPKKG